MPRYRVEESDSVVSVELTDVAGRQEQLLGAFAACQSGQCSCPTDEYEKLDTMEVEQTADEIRLRLEPKPGKRLDLAAIAACLDYTTANAATHNATTKAEQNLKVDQSPRAKRI